jgi:distribution and morphology protein 31
MSFLAGPIRAGTRAQPIASSSRSMVTRSVHSDRYATIHAFFVRQASQVPSTTPAVASRSMLQRRWNSNKKQCEHCPDPQASSSASAKTAPSTPTIRKRDHAQDYTPFIKRLIASSKVIQSGSPHRPSKEELLAAASGWWQRFRIRLKWFTIRGWRRFNADDFSAFASWFVLGNSKLFRSLYE